MWTGLRKGNFKRETESLLTAAQNNAIKNNHTKTRIRRKQNSRCWLCGERDETINHIISKCSKLALKKYKTRHDWVTMQGDPRGIVEVWPYELMVYAQLNICPGKWDAQTPLRFWDKTDYQIFARWPDLIIINKEKENLQNCELCYPSGP